MNPLLTTLGLTLEAVRAALGTPAASPEAPHQSHPHGRPDKLRDRQSVWCCGRNYQRWRFRLRDWAAGHHTHCCVCGQPLAWPPSRIFPVPNPKRAAREFYRRRSARFLGLGLTSRGTVPTRAIPVTRGEPTYLKRAVITDAQRKTRHRMNSLAHYHTRAAEFAARGLTTRGTPRQRIQRSAGLRPGVSPIEHAYQTFRASLNIMVPENLPDLKRENL